MAERGRPSVMPGEPSIPVSVSLEQSLHRKLRIVADQERYEGGFHEVIRVALREFISKKFTKTAA